ncbi:hypothetical protein 2AV2_143 [Nodularia phage vB_NpeS-2AV2]|uniref:Uncharacterized protein n=1 Tax=Nodularia phage vB_NpeS-2AV2 TaxID=1777122 RepID=A0A1L2BX39_9CAUD|nr:hypothetical protein HWA92_gp143 [Nodularia phage vB_NpeS-2AV2]ALY07595.1 hypothetical protein 2AV2_143 [Nodularia phage vB_NpeS-2AV2]
MYCKIQNEPLSEIIPYWQVTPRHSERGKEGGTWDISR